VVVVATSRGGQVLDAATLAALCRERLPAYMVPSEFELRDGPLPRNANGKIDRKSIAAAFVEAHAKQPA
jgi:acyl-CoA synthetase (AMP-forming)/AMP-acid ligase II